MKQRVRTLFAAFLFLQTVPSATVPPASVPPPSTGPAVNFFTPRQDIEIGTDSSKTADQQLTVVRDVPLNQYVRAIADRVLAELPDPAPGVNYQFRIVNSPDINSLGFPNGAIYLYRGLLDDAANDDEVAAVIAHEVGHVSSRHATSQLSRQLLVLAPISLSAGLPSTEGWKEQLTKLGVTFGVNASFLHYSPDQEREATEVAEALLSAAHFNPGAFNTIFQKVNEESTNGDVLPTFPYNHPLAISDTAIEGPVRRIHASPEFKAFHSALMKLASPATEDPPESSDLVPNVFAHEYYRLNYPEGWQITRTGPNGAIIAPTNGVQTSPALRDDITRGVMFDIFALEKPMTLEQATARVIVYLRQANAGQGSSLVPADQTLRAVPGAQTAMWMHGEPALRTVLLGRSQATGASELVWLVTRMYYQNLFYMVFVAPEEEFAKHQPVFEQILGSVQIR
jgi:Peptidase family M48